MKKIITILVLLMVTVSYGQNKNESASLEVDGVCVMCKTRIEKASLKTKGVKSAVWNVQTHELKVIYDARKTNLDSIQNNIASAGHDTKEIKATDAAYASVHPCCRYRDEAVKADHEKDDN